MTLTLVTYLTEKVNDVIYVYLPIVCADVYVVEQFSCLSQREEV